MRAIYLAPALLLSALAFTPASAAPAAAIQGDAVTPALTLTQYGYHDNHHRYRKHYDGKRYRHPHYVPGHRYHSAPHGWHRYGRRPHNWQTRGCILVGPIWFCP